MDEYSQADPNDFGGPRSMAISEEGVEVPYQRLGADTLDQLIRSFVLREGTDYGDIEASMQRKVSDILDQLKSGKLRIVFDLSSDSGSILPAA